ncbi:hypothetical protein GCM10010486_78800 [Nonomuraea roseoviolacea subsp. carminata]
MVGHAEESTSGDHAVHGPGGGLEEFDLDGRYAERLLFRAVLFRAGDAAVPAGCCRPAQSRSIASSSSTRNLSTALVSRLGEVIENLGKILIPFEEVPARTGAPPLQPCGDPVDQSVDLPRAVALGCDRKVGAADDPHPHPDLDPDPEGTDDPQEAVADQINR